MGGWWGARQEKGLDTQQWEMTKANQLLEDGIAVLTVMGTDSIERYKKDMGDVGGGGGGTDTDGSR